MRSPTPERGNVGTMQSSLLRFVQRQETKKAPSNVSISIHYAQYI